MQSVDHPEQPDDGVEGIFAGGGRAEAVKDLLGQRLVGQHRALGAPCPAALSFRIRTGCLKRLLSTKHSRDWSQAHLRSPARALHRRAVSRAGCVMTSRQRERSMRCGISQLGSSACGRCQTPGLAWVTGEHGCEF
jgi:hypothetical protein